MTVKQAFPNFRVQDEHYIGEGLSLDIFLPDFVCGIELHGKQHYEFSPFFHTDSEGWEDQKRLDKRKIDICDREEYCLIVFRYDEHIDDIEYVKNKILKGLGEFHQ